jgi:hypothetical protein
MHSFGDTLYRGIENKKTEMAVINTLQLAGKNLIQMSLITIVTVNLP